MKKHEERRDGCYWFTSSFVALTKTDCTSLTPSLALTLRSNNWIMTIDAASEGRTAAFRVGVERRLRAVHDNYEIENRLDCCAMQISTQEADCGPSLYLHRGSVSIPLNITSIIGFGSNGFSDRGGQYLSIRYTERLALAGIEPSVGNVGDAYDNALSADCFAIACQAMLGRNDKRPLQSRRHPPAWSMENHGSCRVGNTQIGRLV
jgi:hypothetical protein